MQGDHAMTPNQMALNLMALLQPLLLLARPCRHGPTPDAEASARANRSRANQARANRVGVNQIGGDRGGLGQSRTLALRIWTSLAFPNPARHSRIQSSPLALADLPMSEPAKVPSSVPVLPQQPPPTQQPHQPPHAAQSPQPGPPAQPRLRMLLLPKPRKNLLASMRVRKKLLVLHTLFSAMLAAALLLAIRPSMLEILSRAQASQSRIVLEALASRIGRVEDSAILDQARQLAPRAILQIGSSDALGLEQRTIDKALATPGRAVPGQSALFGSCAVLFLPTADQPRYYALIAPVEDARAAIINLYFLVMVALLAAYALVAIALEVFVLPQNVYRPIRRLLAADQAVQDGRQSDEIIPREAIPSDELGEIMQSRNHVITSLRAQEHALADALAQLERVANDLARKNHLLEAARRNLADADRLASLGMMSAGIAHELNTPLAVLKGMVERLAQDPRAGLEPAQAALMVRVVGRLERLGDSLLDFARARQPRIAPASIRTIVDEAVTLVRLDREARHIDLVNNVPDSLVVPCDGDRLIQVFVNLLRNAVDATRSAGDRSAGASSAATHAVTVEADTTLRDGASWAQIRVIDEGSGIDPAILPHVFEPFSTTRLDARGTGLGLAVSDGIVREHSGLILARNRADRHGAIFEVILPMHPDAVNQANPLPSALPITPPRKPV